MNKTYHYYINQITEKQTVEQYLRQLGYSKKLLIHLKKTPMGIAVNQRHAYTTHLLKAGEQLTIRLIETSDSAHIAPIKMDLPIVYEDEDLWIINKPAGMPVHPSQGHYHTTLANGMAYYCRQRSESFVFRAINRLDRDTTGLLILARNMLSAAILYQMVKDHRVEREYLAAVSGKLTESGIVCAPIGRKDGSAIERCIDFSNGEYACTHYHPVYYQAKTDYTFVRLRLETGRTHQIRVHMKYLGHPLPGDFLYHPDFHFISRQALHCSRISFMHPLTGVLLTFEAPLPDDLKFMDGR